jgi:DNA-binding NarL/FixJ family response regulator
MTEANTPRLRVLLADDNPEMLKAVRSILDPKFEVVGTASDGQELIDAEANLKPEIGILDISMPVMNGIKAAREIARRGSKMKVVFLTVNEGRDFVRAAFECGGSAYVLKRQMVTDLNLAIEETLAGRRFVSPGCDIPRDIRSTDE